MSFQGDSIFWVEVEKIVPNPFQPRREFDQERLQELADSIRMYGVLQPLTVTKREVNNEDGSFHSQYELIAGERRLRASKLAGVELVPVIIRSGEQTEQEKLELAIIENLQREDLNAVDRALAFKQLAEMFELSHSQVAKKVGRSREYVSNSIRLLALPEHMLTALKYGNLSEGHARTLLMLKDKPEEQEVVYKEILLKKLSVREVERIARKIATDKVRKKQWDKTDAHLIEMERAFTDTLGTRVQILKTEFGGKLTIDYFSEQDLDTLLSAISTSDAKIHAELPPELAGTTTITELPTEQSDSPDDIDSLAAATPLQPAETAPDKESEPMPEPSPTPAPTVSQAPEPAPTVAPTPEHQVPTSTELPATEKRTETSNPTIAASYPAATTPIKNIDLNEELPEPPAEDSNKPNQDLQQQLNQLSAAVQSEVEPGRDTPSSQPVAPAAEVVSSPASPTEPTPSASQAEEPSHNPSQTETQSPNGEEPRPQEPKKDEDDLYSLRNFSI